MTEARSKRRVLPLIFIVILQCFSNYKNGYLGRLVSAIFLTSPLSILAWEPKQMAWLSKVSQSFLGTQSIAAQTKLSQSDKTSYYHNDYCMLSSFVRTLPFKFNLPTTCLAPETFDDPVHTVNRILYRRLVSSTAAWLAHRRLVSSVGRESVCCAGGRGFEP